MREKSEEWRWKPWFGGIHSIQLANLFQSGEVEKHLTTHTMTTKQEEQTYLTRGVTASHQRPKQQTLPLNRSKYFGENGRVCI